jgi:hypothetical protein
LSDKSLDLQIKKKEREKIIMVCIKTDEKSGPGGFYKVEEVWIDLVDRLWWID